MTLEIQVLSGDKHNNMAGLNQLISPPLLIRCNFLYLDILFVSVLTGIFFPISCL